MLFRPKKRRSKLLANYRQAQAVEPDPLRRITSFLIAFGIVVSVLVLADAIRYVTETSWDDERAPVVLGLVDLEGNVEDVDRGQQLAEPEKEDPVDEPAQEEAAEEPPKPPALAVAENDNPPGPAETDNTSKRAGVIATPGTGPSPRAIYSNRGGAARAKAVGRYGGDAKTENAVKLGLGWLARHQDQDGKWSRMDFDKHCEPGRKCGGAGQHPTTLDPAVTGLALLAFCASNNTHEEGEYKKNVAAAVEYLQAIQTESGGFGDYPRGLNYHMMYNQGIATFALAELCAMTGDKALLVTVENAVRFIVRAQQASGAWDYTDAKTGRYDTSVTGWQVMALKSAHAAGVKVPAYTIYRTAQFFDLVTLSSGEVIYSNAAPSAGRRGPGMAAVGMASCQFLGFPVASKTAARQASVILAHPPDWAELSTGNPDFSPLNSIYYWYYATIAMFQYGGEPWDRWNKQMKKALLAQQRRGGCLDGSWDPPVNFWGQIGGRLYSTTLSILDLEIYYRYLPAYGGGTLATVDALIEVARTRNRQSDAIQAVRLLGKFDDERASVFLVEIAHGDDHTLALEASVALAGRKDEAAVRPLLEQLRSSNQFVRRRALSALAPMIGGGLVPVFIESLRDEAPTVARLAAETLRRHANVSFGFEPEASARDRDAAIDKWRQWWEEHKRGQVTIESSLPWLVVSVDPERGMVGFSTGRPGLAGKGETYHVFRGDDYVGRIDVIEVDGEIAIGRVLGQYTVSQIQKGDVVKPRE